MDCNVCEAGNAQLAELSYLNGDAFEMYLCGRCEARFISDNTVKCIKRFPMT